MRRWPLFPILMLALTPLACYSAPGSSATNVAIGTGMAVAAAAINRAATKDCWAACRPGLVCDHGSGLCVEAGSVQASSFAREHPLEPINANLAGREYEVPALAPRDADAGASADAGTSDASAP
jgi:hypothetical protein